MFKPISTSDNDRYEQACDQAIAMCDGNTRSAIKALLLVNEYLETEIEELQTAALSDRAQAGLALAKEDAA
jgi:hypothetical protein